MSIKLRPHDLVRETIPALAGQASPIDVAEFSNGWLLRASREGTAIKIARSKDRGASWESLGTARSGVVSGTAATGCSPSLHIDRNDVAWLGSHDSTPTARVDYSDDYGATWTLKATISGSYFPRVASIGGGYLQISHTGTALEAYRSFDQLSTRTLASSLSSGTLQRLAALEPDRKGNIHLVYTGTGGALKHRYSEDFADTWSAETELYALPDGEFPAYAWGFRRAALAHWIGTTLRLAILDETGFGGYTAGGSLSAQSRQGCVGLTWTNQERLILVTRVGAEYRTWYSDDDAASWAQAS